MPVPTTTLKVDFVSESAGYRNTFGWYNNKTGYGGILFADVNSEGANAALQAGVSSATFTINAADLGDISYFLISDGYTLNKSDPDDLTGAIKVIKTANGSWAVADVDANGNVIRENGKDDILKGAGVSALFTETSKNAGGVDYASNRVGANQTAASLAGDTADGATGLIAWEDLAATRNILGQYSKPGDADYNDAVFNISIVSSNRAPVAVADAASVGEDAAILTINVLSNDTDPDAGDVLHVASVNASGLLGTIAISANGLSIVYTPAAAFQSLAAGQTRAETFTYTVADQAGLTATATATVTIVGANDAASIAGAAAGAIGEDATLSASGLLAVADVDTGEAAFRTPSSLAGTYGTFSFNAATGQWGYTLTNAAANVQALAGGAQVHDTLTVTSLDGTASKVIDVVITGRNDGAVISGSSTGAVAEDTTLTASGVVAVADVDTGEAAFRTPSSLAGTYGTFSFNAATGQWGYALTNGAANVQALAGGAQVHDTLTVTSLDGTASKVIDVVITGRNDGAVISGSSTGAVAEDATLTASGVVAVADVDTGEAAFRTPSSLTGTYGTFSFNAATGQWGYALTNAAANVQALAGGAQVHDTLTVTSLDGTASKVIDVVITGRNDGAVISGSSTGAVAEDATLTASGVVAVADVDTGEAAFRTPSSLAGTYGTFSFNAATGQWGYALTNAAANVQALAGGAQVHDTLTVTSLDGTASKVIDVVITGRNDGAVISGSSTGAVAEDATLTASGVVAVADVDTGEAAFRTPSSLAGTYGTFSFNAATGQWGYALTNAAANVQALAGGAQVHDTLTVTSLDGTASKVIDVVITGANDTPFSSSLSNTSVAENAAGAIIGTLSTVDVDSGDSHSYSVNDARFQVVGNVLQLKSGIMLDYESEPTVSLNVTATDAGGLSRSSAFVIAVSNVNEAPTAISLSNVSVNEGSKGAQIGTLTAADPDAAQTFSYTVDDDRFTVINSVLSLKGGIALNFTEEPSVALNITVKDAGGFGYSQSFTIAVNDGAESTAIDGYISGATVFADANGNLQLDPGEASAVTDATGNFRLFGGSGSIVMIGGTDISTGLAFNGVMRAPAGSTVVTPLTTLVAALVATGQTASNATASVLTGLGLDSSINLSTFDPIAASLSTDAAIQSQGQSAFAAAIQLQNTIVQAASLLEGAGATFADASAAVIQKLATAVNAAAVDVAANVGSATDYTINLGSAAVISGVIQAAAAGNPDIDAQTVSLTVAGASAVITASNSVVDAAVGNGQSAEDFLSSLTQVASVAQGSSASALSSSAETGGANIAAVQTSFTGSALTAAVAAVQVDLTAILGVNGPELINGTANSDTLEGFGGNDTIFGLGSNDLLIGDAGDDFLDGGAGFDRSSYNTATGAILVDMAAGLVTGDASTGTDTLRDIEFVRGTAFGDTYSAFGMTAASANAGTVNERNILANFNEFEGGAGNDMITGNGSTRVSYQNATAGVTVNLQTGIATGDASVGTDTLNSGIVQVRGSAYDDVITGTSSTTVTEQFEGGLGNDTFFANGGLDRVQYVNASGSINVALASGTVTGADGTDTLRSVEFIRGSAFADTYDATGFSGTSTNAGSNGTFNEFEGGGGNDSITGNGNTRIAFYIATGGVTVDMAAGTADGDTSVGHDTFTGVTQVVGSYFNDTIRGGSGNDVLDGWHGNDLIDGRTGFDTVIYNNTAFPTGGITVDMASGLVDGGAFYGNDTLRGIEAVRGSIFDDVYVATGYSNSSLNANNNQNNNFNQFEGVQGNDTITGNGNTTVSYSTATGAVTINLGTGVVTGDSSVGTDTIVNGVNAGIGSGFADTFIATGFANLPGVAFPALNLFQGGAGNDTIVGNGSTLIQYSQATAGVTVNFITGIASGNASVGTDSFSGVSNVQGSNFADRIIGGTGAQFVSMGSGDDTFVYANGGGGDVLQDFIVGAGSVDRIDLKGVSGIFNLSDVLSRSSQQGANILIDFGGGNNITIQNAALASLSAGDFIFGVAPVVSGPLTVLATEDNTSTTISALVNASDADGDVLSVVNLPGSLPAGVTFNAGMQSFVLDPSASAYQSLAVGQSQTISVTYGISDGASTANAVLNWTITGSNDLPVVTGAVTGIANEDGPAVTLDGLVNASDVDAGNLLSIVNVPASLPVGVTYDAQTHRFTLDPSHAAYQSLAAGAQTVVSVNYAVSDATGSTPASVSWTLTGTNDAPAVTGTVAGAATELATTSTLNAFANASDVDSGSVLTVINLPGTLPAGVTFNAGAGTFTFDPTDPAYRYLDTGVSMTVSVAYSVSDGLASTPASVSWTVSGIDNVVTGTAGFDTLTGGAGRDIILGLAGDDVLTGLAGNDSLNGGDGIDRANYSSSTSALNFDLASGLVSGDASVGTDTLYNIENIRGTNFADTFTAVGFGLTSANPSSVDYRSFNGVFNDFEGLGGNDSITGNGATRVTYTNSTGAVTVDLNAGTATGNASVGQDTFFGGISQIRGSAFADTLTGTQTVNGLYTDQIEGGAGNDTINGLGGFDRAVYTNESGAISVNMASGQVVSPDGTDTLLSIESVRGTGFADTFTSVGFSATSANQGSNGTFAEFEGLGGNDTMTGTGNTRVSYFQSTGAVTVTLTAGGAGTATGDASVGTDTFTGGINQITGSYYNDMITGSNNAANTTEFFDGWHGDDTIDGGGGFDMAVYSNAAFPTGGIVVAMAAGTVAGGDFYGNDLLRSVESVRGSIFADTFDATGFTGTSANAGSNGTFNEFEGMAGNDTITGNGNTRISFVNATGGVLVDYFTSTPNGVVGQSSGDASVGTDTFTLVSQVRGSAFNDTILGGNGGNTLDGQGGNDRLMGRAGADTLTGGAGNDVFVFNNITEGQDTVTDFVSGTDQIEISAVGFGSGLVANATPTLLTSGDFATVSNAGTNGYFIFDNAGADTGTVYWDADGGSGSNAVALVKLTGVTALLASDFHVL